MQRLENAQKLVEDTELNRCAWTRSRGHIHPYRVQRWPGEARIGYASSAGYAVDEGRTKRAGKSERALVRGGTSVPARQSLEPAPACSPPRPSAPRFQRSMADLQFTLDSHAYMFSKAFWCCGLS
eukprot:6205202-Pleurochrysis_carterae.AAC.1